MRLAVRVSSARSRFSRISAINEDDVTPHYLARARLPRNMLAAEPDASGSSASFWLEPNGSFLTWTPLHSNRTLTVS
jgi:hypothetical protein